MPPFDLDLTDPTPAALETAMCDAVKTANGKARVGLLKEDRGDYRAFLAGEFTAPEGVMMWLSDKGRVPSYPPTPRGTLLGVVWRTTPLGRLVRVVENGQAKLSAYATTDQATICISNARARRAT